MKLLLTSAGLANRSITDALVKLLGKPVAEATALVIPTAAYADAAFGGAWRVASGRAKTPLAEVGWKSLGLLELTALPSVATEQWTAAVRQADVLLVGGGDPVYLAHWLRASGLAGILPSLDTTVWVGVSAGSLVVGHDLVGVQSDWPVPDGGVAALGLVDFDVFPHLDNPDMPAFSSTEAERWAAGLDVPGYAIDDQTALTIVDGEVAVVSEGRWRLFDIEVE